MRLVPEDNVGKVMFFQTHLGVWAEHAAAIGVSPAEVALLQEEFDAARAAYQAQGVAQQEAMTATQRMNNAIETMCRRGSAIVQQIRAAARTHGDAVYNLAMIPPPDEPSTIAPPGEPTRFTTSLDQVGWLTLEWKCKNPRGSTGTVYHVRRQLDGVGPFAHLAIVGKKKYTDRSVPPGTRSAIYEVQAIRTTRVGPISQHSVNFGSIISEAEARKMYRAIGAA